MRWLCSILTYALLGTLLVGCGGQSKNMKQTQEFVEKTQQTKSQTVEPLPQFTTPELPQSTPIIQRNPFSPLVENTQLKPDTNHIPGPLESFALTDLHYVGILSQSNMQWGLISAPNGAIYSVTIGQYIGQNYGKVTQITSDKIVITETVSDGLGGWTIRKKELAITTGGQQGTSP